MITRHDELAAIEVRVLEGERVRDGTLLVRPVLIGDEMTMLETFFPQGVRAPLHAHAHESLIYLVKGSLKMFVGSEEYVLGPGDACRHPKGVSHRIEAIEDSVAVEVKSPPPELGRLLGS